MNFIKRNLKRKSLCIGVLLLLLFVYLNNSSAFTQKKEREPFLLAHRGMAQTFHMEDIQNDTCTAERIYEPEHNFLENTIPSMDAAFESGADMVELDIHITKDDQFAVFHDWTLDCRTNGKGVTRDYTMSELKKLDIGYGYTANGGKTYPFRGKGVNLMPSLDEVMNHFPKQSLLIHVKSNDPKEGEQLANYFSRYSEKHLKNITVYGGDEPIDSLKKELPNLKVMSKKTMKACLFPYIAVGWSGYVPNSCKNTELHIPEKIAPFLWGWPNRFLNRMENRNTRTIVVGGDGSEFSTGFDSIIDLKRLPEGFSGGIWTNRIDKIGPYYKKN